jgi:hypothetical protein
MNPAARAQCISAAFAATLSLVPALPAGADPIEITFTPVPLDTADPIRTFAGELEFLGGLRLRSPDPSFGGLSGLWVDPAGSSLVAVTDQGAWFSAGIVYSDSGLLAGLSDAAIEPMRGIDDLPLLPPWSDAESIAVADGDLYVAFERENRLYRYGPPEAPWSRTPEWMPLPEEIAAGPRNGGMEAITGLAGGAVLAFAEEIRRGDGLAAWILLRESVETLTLSAEGGYLPTGATTLAGGDVLLLERRFSLFGGFAVRIRRIAAADIAPGAVVSGREVAIFAPPLTTDNFESLAAVGQADGGTLLFLLSDDNFSALQRTLLMLYRMPPG